MKPRVLILGADGFIGRHIAFGLRARGYDVVASARKTDRLTTMGFEVLQADLTDPRLHTASGWAPHVTGVTHVVNAAGVLHASKAVMSAVHVDAPRALYTALSRDAHGVLISAVGIKAGTDFAHFRQNGEKVAKAAHLTILRPGLVLGDTSYGGSSLGRALAAFPLATPLIGGGSQPINPIHVDDLSACVSELLEQAPHDKPLEIGGAQTLTQAEMLTGYRKWFGLRPVRGISIPASWATRLGRLGDILHMGPISATAVAQLNVSLIADDSATRSHLNIQPRGFSEFVWSRPAGTQDLWQARLYLIKPLLRLSLALLWIASACVGLFLPSTAFLPIFAQTGLPDGLLLTLARGGGIIDLFIGIALLRNWRPQTTAWMQIGMVGGYTLGLTLLSPSLWALPFGGLLKNIPILVLLLIHLALVEER